MTHKLQLKNIALSLVLTLAMVAGALPFITQTGHAAKGFDVYIDDGISNGEVSSDKPYTSGSGETVTLTVTPDDDYKLKKLSVIQPDVLSSISDLVSLMGGAEFATNGGYSVKIDEGQFSIFYNGTEIANLDNSANLDNDNASYGYYSVISGHDYWYFYIIGGKLRTIAFQDDGDYDLNFTGTGAKTISGTEIATTVTEDGKYTFAAPRSNVYVTAEFEMIDPKTVLIDVGKGHESLFTSEVLNKIKDDFSLEDVTISGNVITLKGVHPNKVEADLRNGIHNVVGSLISDSGYRHNGEELIDVAYKAIDDYATFQDYFDDTYNDERWATKVSDGMTYYLLWKKPYEKLELDNGSPTCGKQASEAMPTIPDAFTLLEFETHWKDENNDSVKTFEGGKKYTLKGVLELQRSSGFWKYYVPDDFVLTVEGGTGVECSVIVGTYIEFSFTATAEHDWDEGTVTKEATETAEGEKTFKCKHCGATKTESIPKITPKKDEAKPAAPKVSTVASTSARAMTVKWTMKWGKVNGAKSYKVAYRKVGSKKWTYKTTKKTKYVVKGHKMRGLYEYKVAAVSKKGTTWSGTSRRYFSRVSDKAKAGKGSIKVSWKKDKTATGYQVLVATNKNMKNSKKFEVGKSAKSYKIKGLKKGKRYYVRVRPMKTHGGVTYKGILSKTKSVRVK